MERPLQRGQDTFFPCGGRPDELPEVAGLRLIKPAELCQEAEECLKRAVYAQVSLCQLLRTRAVGHLPTRRLSETIQLIRLPRNRGFADASSGVSSAGLPGCRGSDRRVSDSECSRGRGPQQQRTQIVRQTLR